VGSGLAYASLGPSHHSLEDISFLKTLPNMTVICPVDALELKALLYESIHLKINGPIYFRIGKKGEPLIYENMPNVSIGKANIIKEGKDICKIVCGNIATLALEIEKDLKQENVSCQVVSMHTIKPLDINLLDDIFNRFNLVVSIEEHSLIGGLGSSLSEWIVDNNKDSKKFIRFGTKDSFPKFLGDQKYLQENLGLKKEKILLKIKKTYENKSCNISRC